MNNNKIEMSNLRFIYLNLIILVLVSLFLISFVSAQLNLNLPHKYEPAVPKLESLEVRGQANVDLFTGSATYQYPIQLSPGTNGLTPSLALTYSSSSRGEVNSVGSNGWSITENYIGRDTNSTANTTSDDIFELVLNGIRYNLIHSPSEDRYYTEIDSYLHIHNKTGAPNSHGKYWVVKTGDGTSYQFGYYKFSELNSTLHNYTWRWSLDFVSDTYGNSIVYNYSENPYSGDVGSVYLDKIQYNTNRERVVEFVYESQNRPDMRKNVTIEGNVNFQSRRLKEIYVRANEELVRRYLLSYSSYENDTSLISTTFLSNITEYGLDNSTSLPSPQFSYTPLLNGYHEDSSWNPPECFTSSSGGDEGSRFIDVNNDGFVDFLTGGAGGSSCSAGVKRAYLNNGTGWVRNDTWAPPYCFTESNGDTGLRPADVNGDGFTDFLRGLENSK